jgi:voltage-gated potassium channel
MLSAVRIPLKWFVVAILAIVVAGTAGYMVIEGWSLVESVYMTVITLSTVGFSEVRPLSPAGRVFTAGVIVAGVVSVTSFFAALAQYIVSGELTGSLRRSRMQRRIEELEGHFIVCGFGRVGQQVVLDLLDRGRACVVIEHQADALATTPRDAATLEGDATDDATLAAAGIARAGGLVAATGDDATNLFITLTARTLSPTVTIVARANQPASEPKLKRAGASHVLSPYTLSGRRIARQLLCPSVTEFLDVVMHSAGLELVLEECRVEERGGLTRKTVAEADVRRETGANILAVRRRDQGAIVTNPPSEMRFEPGDVLIALGTVQQLAALRRVAGEAARA